MVAFMIIAVGWMGGEAFAASWSYDGSAAGGATGDLAGGAAGDLYYHADMLGTSRMLTDETPAVDHRLRFTAFGEPLPLPAPGEPPTGPPTASTRYGFAGSFGYQHDGLADAADETGALHVGWRHYDPVIGRFRERDPIGIWGGVNVYEYVRNSPTSGVDPLGLSEFNYSSLGLATKINAILRSAYTSVSLHTSRGIFEIVGTVEGAAVIHFLTRDGLVLQMPRNAILTVQWWGPAVCQIVSGH